jgi:trans-2,3-dihydro-3-hydroxyanthranilate isomerase
MPRRFVTLDVFTDTPLAGNPLAVVLDSEGLDTAAMQAIAKEFNLSETVFVSPPADPARRADIRIFTPNYEMPFAGHPTIGTAVLLAIRDVQVAAATSSFTLGEKVGPIPCRVTVQSALRGSAAFDVAELPRRIGDIGPVQAIAAALGVEAGDVGFAGVQPGYYSAGTPFAIVPLASVAAVDKANADRSLWPAAFGMNDRQSVFMMSPGTGQDSYYARMFAFGRDMYEDPATGSASAAVAAMIAQAEAFPDGSHERMIHQGYLMGRPSWIGLTCHVSGGALKGATIGGEAVIISEGVLHL